MPLLAIASLVLAMQAGSPSSQDAEPVGMPAQGPAHMDAGTEGALEVVRAYDAGFRAANAAAIAAQCSDDVEWTNAVGIQLRGKARLRAFLARLLARPEIEGSTDGPLQIVSARLVSPGVAVVFTTITTAGQTSMTTQKKVDRVTHELFVIKREDGRWRIVDDLISDEARDL